MGIGPMTFSLRERRSATELSRLLVLCLTLTSLSFSRLYSFPSPLFIREDGEKTFDIDVALSWIGQEPVKEEEIVERR